MEGEVVAYFKVRITGEDPVETNCTIDIRGNDLFYLGRSQALCRKSWRDPTISNRHLRIHCILYEQDLSAHIRPLVYVTDLSRNGTYFRKRDTEGTGPWPEGCRMGPKNKTLLLDDCDEIQLSQSVTLVYEGLPASKEERLSEDQLQEVATFAPRYLVTNRTLGEGAHGKVLLSICQKTQKQLACKVVNVRSLLEKLRAANRESSGSDTDGRLEKSEDELKKRLQNASAKCFREFGILKNLNHPNIIAIEKVFWSSNTIYIFQELVMGGDLFSYLQYKGGRLCDVQAAVIIRQVLKGVEYLHGQDIVHRDLKPDNILMSSPDDGARVVITDFGHARLLPRDKRQTSHRQRIHSVVGTWGYIAPEVLEAGYESDAPVGKGYSKSVDMWSVGSITAALISGDVLFSDRTSLKCAKGPALPHALQCEIDVIDDESHPTWSYVGRRAKSFIKSLLIIEERHRLIVSEALAHSWFTNEIHVADFEALYKRSTKLWESHRKTFCLVEPIAQLRKTSAHFTRTEDCLSQSHSSYDPTTSSQHGFHSIIASLRVSQGSQMKPPLPSIFEDNEEEENDKPLTFKQPSNANIPHSSKDLDVARYGNDMSSFEGSRIDAYTPEPARKKGAGSGSTSRNKETIDASHQNESFSVRQDSLGPEYDPESVLVPETPPQLLGKRHYLYEHSRPHKDSLFTQGAQVGDKPKKAEFPLQDRVKRSKLSHYA